MMVAWHEVPGIVYPDEPSCRVRYDMTWSLPLTRGVELFVQAIDSPVQSPIHTVPYGTVPYRSAFQALRARLPSSGPYGTESPD
jgi:hypothetical protein